jgi:Chlorophyll A-B binding protein
MQYGKAVIALAGLVGFRCFCDAHCLLLPCAGGSFFNLFNFGRDAESMKGLKAKEIENGRLAMLAMFGYGAQAVMTSKGPIDNLFEHLSDPVHNNILANFGKILH